MKILYSPGFGAGWSSWCSDEREAQVFMLTYKPLIDALEAGKDIGAGNSSSSEPRPGSILDDFARAYKERFGDVPYLGGARDLTVTEVTEPFRIHEYDGSESVECREKIGWFDPDTDFLHVEDEDFG